MPKQEVYLELKRDAQTVRVLKTYDMVFAREAFESLGTAALEALADSLRIEENFDPTDVPKRNSPEYEDFLWEALVDEAQEDGRLRSYFVVEVALDGSGDELAYVSADWPSAEAFAKSLAQPTPANV